MPGHYGSHSNKKSTTGGSTNRERGADRNRSQTLSPAVRARNTAAMNKVKADKGRDDLTNYQVKKVGGVGVIPFILNAGQSVRQKTFEVNRDYFRKNVVGKGYSDTFADYQRYITGRGQGKLDAMGRTINTGGNDRDTAPTIMAEAQAPVQTPTQTVAQTEEEIKPKKAKIIGSGYGQRNILSSASGVEDEANVSRTVLGGGVKRKIRL